MPNIKIRNASGKVGGPVVGKISYIAGKNQLTLASFSLSFNPEVLKFQEVTLADHPNDTNVFLNEDKASEGKVGVVIQGLTPYPSTRKYLDLLNFTFQAKVSGKTSISFSDDPVQQVVAIASGVLFPTKFIAGKVTITK